MKKEKMESQIELINEDAAIQLGGAKEALDAVDKVCGNLRTCGWNSDTCPKLESCTWN